MHERLSHDSAIHIERLLDDCLNDLRYLEKCKTVNEFQIVKNPDKYDLVKAKAAIRDQMVAILVARDTGVFQRPTNNEVIRVVTKET